MCGRLTQQLSSEEIARLFDAKDEVHDAGGNYNVAPTQPIRAILERDDERVLTILRWGLVPPWADSLQIGARLINARGETLAEKPSFRTAFRRHRCLIPADSFYEWQTTPGGKTPYVIERQDGQPLAMAGLWSSWRAPTTSATIPTCTIVTTTANALVAPVHDRMPVILPTTDWDEWLDPANENVAALQSLLRPFPADQLTAYRVAALVNNVRNNGPELVQPLAGGR
jgi:putative SOS response-associated peptidase YedK